MPAASATPAPNIHRRALRRESRDTTFAPLLRATTGTGCPAGAGTRSGGKALSSAESTRLWNAASSGA
jgi:hypothetical protein